MKRRDFLKFLGTVPFGIKALQQSDEQKESTTAIEETPETLPPHPWNIIASASGPYDDPGVGSSASSFYFTDLHSWRPGEPTG